MDEMIVICAWCHAKHKDGEEWKAGLPDSIANLPPGTYEVPISHGICPDCRERLNQGLPA
jgi:hypothetical protein